MGQTKFSAQPLDARLKLPLCDEALVAAPGPGVRAGNSRTLIRVACRGTQPWKIYVTLIAERKVTVLVARHTLSDGHRLTAADLTTKAISAAQLRPGYLTDLDRTVGRELRQLVHGGEVLFGHHTIDPVLIPRGQHLDIVRRGHGVSIRMNGIAQEPGRRNQQIRVRNVSSGRIIYARVLSENEVAVGAD